MRWLHKTSLAYSRKGLQLNTAEIQLLEQVGELAERIRDEARRVVPEFEQDDTDTRLAQIEHNTRAIVEEDGYVTVSEFLNMDAPTFEMKG